MKTMRLVITVACLSVLIGCARPPGISLMPRTVRAPSDDQMELLSVYGAFLARQVPKMKWLCCSGRRMEGLLIRKPVSYPGYDRGFTREQVFPDGRFLVHAGTGGTDQSYDLAPDTLKNFYAESARTDDLFAEGQFTGPFIAFRDGEDLNSRFLMEPCHPPKMCGLRLIARDLPNSGGLWSFSHIGFSRDHLQALVFYSDGFWGEGGVALLEKGTAGWTIVVKAVLSVS